MAGIRLLGVLHAFKPYKAQPNPLKILNLETLAALAGCLGDYKNHFGRFKAVLAKVQIFVGDLFVDSKRNLHILFAKTFTQMGSQAYEKVKEKFLSVVSRVRLVATPSSSEASAKPDESKPEPEPKSRPELMQRLERLKGNGDTAFQGRVKTLFSVIDHLKDFGRARKIYQDFVVREHLGTA